LEGRTRREAARRLGIAEGTLSGRLTTARRRLAKRLARYGLPATSSPIVLAPSQAAPSLCAKTPLGVSAIKAAAMVAAGQTTTGVISDKVCAIGEGVMKTMLLTKLKMAIAALSVVGLFLVCLSAVPHPALAEKLPAKRDQRTDGRSPAPRATNHLALRSTMDGHTDAVSSLAFSPDGKLIASGGEDFSIRIWDTAAGKHVLTWAAHQNMVLSLAFSPDGKLLASASSSTIHIDPAKPSPGAVKVWEPATGKEKVQLNGDAGWFSQVAFSPDNKVLAAADEVERKVRLWQAATGKELGALQDDGFGSINSIAFSPDGKTLVVGIANDVDPGAATVQIWDWAAEKVVLRLKATGGCWFVAFTPDGKTLVTVSGAGDLTLWDSEKFERRKSHKLKGTPYAGTAISPDGKTMALGFRMEHKKNQMFDVAGTVELRDNVMGDLLATITLDRSPRSLAFSPTEALLAIGCRGQEKQPLDKKGEGPRMVGGGAGAVQLWELPDLTKHRK
jgi:dipeptidyl aminopeptidase/acylaminoacyl peptidase